MDEEDKYDTETSDVETEAGIRESPQVATIFINKQKIANPNKETAADTDTVFSATVTWRITVWQIQPTSELAWPPFVQIFYVQI